MADDEIDDDMVAAEMSRTQDFDLEAVGDEEYYQLLDTARTRHANCLRFPEIFWYYWEEDSVDEWDEDNSPEAEEWVELGALYVRLSQRNKEARLRRVQDAARQIRRQKLRPLFEGLRQQTAQRQTSHFFSFWYFCVGLKSIERLWLPDSAAAKSAPSPVIERFLVRDACDKAHEEKVRLFLRIARALLEDDTKTAALPESVASMLEYVDSRITDSKQTDVFRSYCLGILGDDEMDPIFARATALFRCGFCSSTFTYPDIANHLVEMHEAGPVTAYAHVPAPCFRRAVKDLLVEMKLPLTTTSSDLADYRFEVEEQSGSGVTITFCDQSWLDVLAGKANCEMAGERRNFDGEKTERAITAIRPTRNSVLSQNLGTS